jgi:hypothetical protein
VGGRVPLGLKYFLHLGTSEEGMSWWGGGVVGRVPGGVCKGFPFVCSMNTVHHPDWRYSFLKIPVSRMVGSILDMSELEKGISFLFSLYWTRLRGIHLHTVLRIQIRSDPQPELLFWKLIQIRPVTVEYLDLFSSLLGLLTNTTSGGTKIRR